MSIVMGIDVEHLRKWPLKEVTFYVQNFNIFKINTMSCVFHMYHQCKIVWDILAINFVDNSVCIKLIKAIHDETDDTIDFVNDFLNQDNVFVDNIIDFCTEMLYMRKNYFF